MDFEVKKAENCFSDAENYEYRICMTGSEFVGLLREGGDEVRINEKLRRPTFIGTLNNGMQVKGLLSKNIIKVGFVPAQAKEQKTTFENWLRGLNTEKDPSLRSG